MTLKFQAQSLPDLPRLTADNMDDDIEAEMDFHKCEVQLEILLEQLLLPACSSARGRIFGPSGEIKSGDRHVSGLQVAAVGAAGGALDAVKRILELLDCGDFFNDFVDPVIRKKLRPDPEPDAWCPVWFVESVTDAAKHMAKHKPQKLNRLIEPIVFRDSSVDDDEILGALEALLTHTRSGGASLSGAGGGLDGHRTCACAWSAKRHESGSGGGEPHLLLDGLVRPSLLWCARARADSHTVEKAVASITAARLRERRTTFNRILLRQPRQDELIEALEALSFERSVSAPQSAYMYYSSLTNEGISNGNTAGARRWLPSVAVVGDSVRRLAAAPLRRLRSRCGRRASRLRAAVKAVLPYSHFSEDRTSVHRRVATCYNAGNHSQSL